MNWYKLFNIIIDELYNRDMRMYNYNSLLTINENNNNK